MKKLTEQILRAAGGLVVAVIMLLLASGAQATLMFDLDTEFSGAAAPVGSTPWVRLTFEDQGSGTIRLTMEALNLTDSEFISEININLDPSLNPGSLSFSVVGTPPVGTTNVNTGVNSFQADGDGKFDVQFDFPPPPGTFAAEFTAGEQVIYDITYTGAGTLMESSFDFSSVEGGGNGTFHAAAHIQGITPNVDGFTSGWIGDGGDTPPAQVPEPGTLLLLGTGLALAFWARRKK